MPHRDKVGYQNVRHTVHDLTYPTRTGLTALLAALTIGCSGNQSSQPQAHDSSSASSSVQVRSQRVVLPIGSEPRQWPVIATLTLGPASQQLGYKRVPGLNPLIPSALVVANDEVWIADPVKLRIARFSTSGLPRGAAAGLSEVASDMALSSGNRIFVIDDGAAGVLRTLRPLSRRLSPPIITRFGGDPGSNALFRLIPTDTGLGIWADEQHPVDAHGRVSWNTTGIPNDACVLGIRLEESALDLECSPLWKRRLLFRADTRRAIAVEVDSAQVRSGRLYIWLLAAEERANHPHGGNFLLEIDEAGRLAKVIHVQGTVAALSPNLARPIWVDSDGCVYQLLVTRRAAQLREMPTPRCHG